MPQDGLDNRPAACFLETAKSQTTTWRSLENIYF
jgi:hypothetical protein